MENTHHYYPHLSSSPRALAMVLALASALMLAPLYADRGKSESRLETRWSSGGLVLPAVVAGLIVAIKTTISSSSNRNNGAQKHSSCYNDDDRGGLVLRVVSSCWGLAGILVMLVFVVSWQASVKHFFWR